MCWSLGVAVYSEPCEISPRWAFLPTSEGGRKRAPGFPLSPGRAEMPGERGHGLVSLPPSKPHSCLSLLPARSSPAGCQPCLLLTSHGPSTRGLLCPPGQPAQSPLLCRRNTWNRQGSGLHPQKGSPCKIRYLLVRRVAVSIQRGVCWGGKIPCSRCMLCPHKKGLTAPCQQFMW